MTDVQESGLDAGTEKKVMSDEEIREKRRQKNTKIMELFGQNAQPGQGYGFDEASIHSKGVVADIFEAAGVAQPTADAEPGQDGSYMVDTNKGFSLQVRYSGTSEDQRSVATIALIKSMEEGQPAPTASFTDYLRTSNPQGYQELTALSH